VKPIDKSDTFPDRPAGLDGTVRPVSPAARNSVPSFEILLRETFDRLESRRNKDSLVRIRRMEEILEKMEVELDEILCGEENPGGKLPAGNV
jgi:hypothetical protein